MEHVAVETQLLVPKTHRVHRIGDRDEVLPELAGDVLVTVVLAGQLERDAEHVQAIHRHPARPVGLFDVPARRQRRAAIEYPDVVQPEKTALKDVPAFGVLSVYPPGEVQHQLVKHSRQKFAIPDSTPFLVYFVNSPGGPAEHRWIHVVEGPFVRRDLAVGCMYHSRKSRISCALAKSGSTNASGMQWNARSHD